MGKREIAVFGGGCFWCTEAVFGELKGVISVMPGYAGGPERNRGAGGPTGGPERNRWAGGPERSEGQGGPEQSEGQRGPTYEEICTGTTGHAEVIKIEFDPEKIAYTDLLTVFFATHNPTTLNRQGNDVGTQYRSIVLYTTPKQKADAEKLIEKLNTSGPKVVTEVQPLETFYPAEEYHRKYYENNSDAPYCQVVINPKLEHVKVRFHELLKDSEKK